MEQIALQKNIEEETSDRDDQTVHIDQPELETVDLIEKVNEVAVIRPLLDKIKCTQDVKSIPESKLASLNEEIRDFLIHKLSKTGGHLAPNLGVVEITTALHRIFDFPKDELIFDVGHQAYVHKMLTGRQNGFESLRQYKGLSGFSHSDESVFDHFTMGHGGTSLSAAFGRALARDHLNEKHHVIALIGDGAFTEGMAFEAMNHLGHCKTRMIIILNDNGMSIAPNVGGFSRYFDRVRDEPHLRSSKEYLKHLVKDIPVYGDHLYQLMSKMKNSFKYLMTPGVIFEELGIRYMGPVDGHDMSSLIDVFLEAKELDRPVIIHCRTTKGKGFQPAEDISTAGAKWHGGGPYDPCNGNFIKPSSSSPSYSNILGEHLTELAKADNKVHTITAAMPDGTGLSKFRDSIPNRFFDVAMAEQHAVTMGAGLASRGLRPFVAIYSTFLQRAFDQIIHDVCLQNLPVRFCMDRSGLVGADGPTHHGVFDMAYLRCIPRVTVMAPSDECEFVKMLNTMHQHDQGPSAIRYPRGSGLGLDYQGISETIEIGQSRLIHQGSDLLIISIGRMLYEAKQVAEKIKRDLKLDVTIVDARFVKPIDIQMLDFQLPMNKFRLVTMEDGCVQGGFGSAIAEEINLLKLDYPVKQLTLGIPDEFVTHGTVSNLCKELKLDSETMFERVQHWLQEGMDPEWSYRLV
ncbi:MAG: 1-deoxy-D-xylulose-5-phosphate synthase [bacterium]|nr:1-deoxy-D-xylulose-5-phosphate synthase [bacterium]